MGDGYGMSLKNDEAMVRRETIGREISQYEQKRTTTNQMYIDAFRYYDATKPHSPLY